MVNKSCCRFFHKKSKKGGCFHPKMLWTINTFPTDVVYKNAKFCTEKKDFLLFGLTHLQIFKIIVIGLYWHLSMVCTMSKDVQLYANLSLEVPIFVLFYPLKCWVSPFFWKSTNFWFLQPQFFPGSPTFWHFRVPSTFWKGE